MAFSGVREEEKNNIKDVVILSPTILMRSKHPSSWAHDMSGPSVNDRYGTLTYKNSHKGSYKYCTYISYYSLLLGALISLKPIKTVIGRRC